MSQLEVGQAAPDFTLCDHDGKSVTLSGLRGHWVVLYFYPKDDTPGCTIQACEFSSSIGDFQAIDALVFGVSPDDEASHQRFRAKHDLSVSLLSDPSHEVMETYEAWGEKNMYGKIKVGVIRSTVIIDPEGKIAHRWKRARAKGNAEAVKKRLELLQG